MQVVIVHIPMWIRIPVFIIAVAGTIQAAYRWYKN
jgi:hypothetical protein